jgi:hypothetical protein
MARGQGKAITRQAHWPDSRIAVFSPRKWRGDEGSTRGSFSLTSSSRPSPRTRSRSSPPRSHAQPPALAELGQHPALDLARLVDDSTVPGFRTHLSWANPPSYASPLGSLPAPTGGLRLVLAGIPRRLCSAPQGRCAEIPAALEARAGELEQAVRRPLFSDMLDTHLMRRVRALRDPVQAPPGTLPKRDRGAPPSCAPPHGALVLPTLAPSTVPARLARGEAEVMANTQNAPDATSARARGGAGTRAELGVPHEPGARARRRTTWRWMAGSQLPDAGPVQPPAAWTRTSRTCSTGPCTPSLFSARRPETERAQNRRFPACWPRSRWRGAHPLASLAHLPSAPSLARVLVRRVVFPLRPDEAAHALVHAVHQAIYGLLNSRGGAMNDSTYVSLATSW